MPSDHSSLVERTVFIRQSTWPSAKRPQAELVPYRIVASAGVTKNHQQPEYELVGAQGSDHDKEYTVAPSVDGKKLSQGVSHTRKQVEQNAAHERYRDVERGLKIISRREYALPKGAHFGERICSSLDYFCRAPRYFLVPVKLPEAIV